MDILVSIPDYEPKARKMTFAWEDGHSIKAQIQGERVRIVANQAGLMSLANHLLALSQESVPAGYDFHLDDSNGLDDGSCELVFERANA